VTAAFAPLTQKAPGHVSPPSSRLLEARRSWRVRRKRKGVNQVLKLFNYAYSLRRNEDGQTMAEYGVVLAVITLAIIGTLTALGTNVDSKIAEVVTNLGG
jgi:pilus assembly protein Flp/PilA